MIFAVLFTNFRNTKVLFFMQCTEFDFNKYTINSSKGCILEVDLKYTKNLQELHYGHPLAQEIKKEMLSKYQVKIADLSNIPISNVKKLVPKEKYLLHYELATLLKIRIKTKKDASRISIQSITMVKTIHIFLNTTHARNRSRKK